jgi:hypothetical protein
MRGRAPVLPYQRLSGIPQEIFTFRLYVDYENYAAFARRMDNLWTVTATPAVTGEA